MSNSITAFFKGRIGVAESVYQDDYGVVLALENISLPPVFDCYFNTVNEAESVSAIGRDYRVAIPNACLTRPGRVDVYIPAHETAYDSMVEYVVSFMVMGRARPADESRDRDRTALSEAVALLNHVDSTFDERIGEYFEQHFEAEQIGEAVDQWLDDHPEATTTVQDHSLSITKLTETALSKLSSDLYYSTDYHTIPGLMQLTAAETYALFDEFVSAGVLTKSSIGYASLAEPSTGDAEEDTTRPIYMYSWSRPAKDMGNFMSSRFNNPILLVSAIHGCEKLGIPALLTMLSDYVDGNPVVRSIFNNHDIDIIPVLNPYGYDVAIQTTIDNVEENIGRVNARGVDLNRNGNSLWAGTASGEGTYNYKGVAPYSECETRALRTVYSAKNYALLIDLHTLRYDSDDNIFGVLYSPSTIVRSLFCDTMQKLYDRIENFGFDLSETNSVGISGSVSPNPQYICDYNLTHNSDVYAMMLEFPRYNTVDGGKVIYPEVIQKIAADILVNFIDRALEILPAYAQSLQLTFEGTGRIKALEGSVFPTMPSDMSYGVVNENGDFRNTSVYRLVNKEPIDVVPGTYKLKIINTTGAPVTCAVYAYDPTDSTNYQSSAWNGDREHTIGTGKTKMYISIRSGTNPDWNFLDLNSYGRTITVLFIPVV